jgi:putative oxidoreductase
MLVIPETTRFSDWSLLFMRLVVALVFGTSGFFHLRSPAQRAQSLGMTVGFTVFLGASELAASAGLALGVLTRWAALGLILVALGAIYMKAVKWQTGFWGEKSPGWHYDLMFVAMNLVIMATAGGQFVLW